VAVQVGPDDLRRNALAGLLVQLAKRDAFNTLRTQQQLGYIVHMYGSTDLGVQVRLTLSSCMDTLFIMLAGSTAAT
jgi:secreted Zn-dependent insulinase-like peptidase